MAVFKRILIMLVDFDALCYESQFLIPSSTCGPQPEQQRHPFSMRLTSQSLRTKSGIEVRNQSPESKQVQTNKLRCLCDQQYALNLSTRLIIRLSAAIDV